jgi:hypothetical protein
MLRPNSNAHEARAHSARDCGAFQQPHKPRQTPGASTIQISAELPSHHSLYPLRHASRKLAAALYLCEISSADRTVAKGSCQQISRCHGILNCEIDSYAAHRRHRVSRVSDAEQAGAIPLPQAVDSDSQQLQVAPVTQFRYAVVQERHEVNNVRAELFDPLGP